jgi:hypothetical protein
MFRWICVAALELTAACDGQPQELDNRIRSLEAENNQFRQTAERADAASARYDACLSDVASAYSSRWDATCVRLRKVALRQRANCKAGGNADEACMSIEVPAAANCSLPTDMADNYDASYKDDQRLCLGRLKVEY